MPDTPMPEADAHDAAASLLQSFAERRAMSRHWLLSRTMSRVIVAAIRAERYAIGC